MKHIISKLSLLTCAAVIPAVSFADGDHDHLNVLTEGHVDILVEFEESEGVHFAIGAEDHTHDEGHGPGDEGGDHDHDGEGFLDPADVLIRGGIAGNVPANPAFEFLGETNSPFYFLPQVEVEGQPFPGFDTEGLSGLFDGPVTLSLDGFEGPGRFSLYSVGSFGDPTLFLGSGPGGPGSFNLPVGTHAHFNWAFSAPGEYEVTLVASLDDGGNVLASAPTTFHIEVIPEPGVMSLLAIGGIGILLILIRRR